MSSPKRQFLLMVEFVQKLVYRGFFGGHTKWRTKWFDWIENWYVRVFKTEHFESVIKFINLIREL